VPGTLNLSKGWQAEPVKAGHAVRHEGVIVTQDQYAFPKMQLMSPAQCEAIHQASLEILRRTGVRVYHSGGLELLRQAGAVVTDDNLVRLPAGLVEWALQQAPSRVALCRRGSSEAVAKLEGNEVTFGTGSDCLHVLDPRTGQHRVFTTQDVVDCVRLVDALPELGFCMSMGIPVDAGPGSHYRRQFALMLEHTVKPIVFVCNDRADCEAIVAMATAAAGGSELLRLNPTLLLYSEPSTPLRHTETATDKLLYMAEMALPVTHSPAPMMGGTAPVTLAGGMALGNAEVLSSLVMHQLKRPGAPFVYAVQVHHLDMRTMISVYGAPEYQLGRAMSADMARHYGLPIWGNAGMSDACALDEQAAIDSAVSVLGALLTGTHLAHDVGYLEGGLTTSPEMIVLTAENIAMMRHFVRGVALETETLALDVIHEVGPGGDFLAQKHTARHFRDYWQPRLFSRQRLDDWIETGKKRLGDRLRDKTLALMETHRPEPLASAVRQTLDDILMKGSL
jgi:trimethylamine---corrinoid protein Co-methyltransferase